MSKSCAARAAEALEPLRERFAGKAALVFAPGPSLPGLWKGRHCDLPQIAINDAWKDPRSPAHPEYCGYIARGADVLYASDAKWYRCHDGVPGFRGGLKVSHGATEFADVVCVQSSKKGSTGYDPELGYICHGSNSGCAAVHLAAQLGARTIVLVGFDFRPVNGKEHFFGKHPASIRSPRGNYEAWAMNFRKLAQELAPLGVEIVNATPGSGLKGFREIRLEDVL